jgi:hypothetical protein
MTDLPLDVFLGTARDIAERSLSSNHWICKSLQASLPVARRRIRRERQVPATYVPNRIQGGCSTTRVRQLCYVFEDWRRVLVALTDWEYLHTVAENGIRLQRYKTLDIIRIKDVPPATSVPYNRNAKHGCSPSSLCGSSSRSSL